MSKLPYVQNRDISWLRFNKRVLDEAVHVDVPLLERLKFLAIFSNNLDEFFMIRMGSLLDVTKVDKHAIDWREDRLLIDQIKLIYKTVESLLISEKEAFESNILNLKKYDYVYQKVEALDEKKKNKVKKFFDDMMAPLLSPQVIDAHHPFPHIPNKMLSLGLRLERKGKEVFGLITLPSDLDEYLLIDEQGITSIILLEDIIYHFGYELFPMYQVLEKTILTVTRNADIHLDEDVFDDIQDVKTKMKKLLNKRKKLAPVRLELNHEISGPFKKYLLEKLELEAYQCYLSQVPLKLAFLFKIYQIISEDHNDLIYEKHKASWPIEVSMYRPIIKQIIKKDILLYFPYDNMEPFLKMLKEASTHAHVRSIKITIYRLARVAKIVEYLAQASENGKEVLVVMELRARFDEQNNIDYADFLKEAGCQIIYGLENYKVHSKLCLITLKDKHKLTYITQIGTGNYNEKTVEQYTDLSLMTANQGIGKDAAKFFVDVATDQMKECYEELLISPMYLKASLLSLIEEEISKGKEGYICMKVNAITEKNLIEALVKASQAGVTIELIIRSICCLVPGVIGYSENISITSVVGRFLEHPRIYVFGKNYEKVYISSSDLMTRSMERRVEIASPIYDLKHKKFIRNLLEAQLKDNIKGKNIATDGTHQPFISHYPFDSQQYYLDVYAKRKKKKISWFNFK